MDMNKDRLNRVLGAMKGRKIGQMLVSDPAAVYYLTGRRIQPGERMQALYLNVNGAHRWILNELFRKDEDAAASAARRDGWGGAEMVWYRDGEDAVEILSRYVEKDTAMGIDRTWPSGFLLRLQELCRDNAFVDASGIMDDVRMVKDRAEQEFMRRSSELNDRAMERLVPWIAGGLTERELAAKVYEIYRQLGCEGVSFEPVVAFGRGAALPHHAPDDTRGKRGDCVVIDIGAYKDSYASDMTRTFFLGEASEDAQEIYRIVLEANRRGILAAKPGNRMCDVDRAARDYIEEKGYGAYFTHRTGHSIGLEDHEAGDVSSVNREVIRPGQCFSVEPGIYIPEKNLGVRIEDLVLITEDGCEVLNHFPKELTVI